MNAADVKLNEHCWC